MKRDDENRIRQMAFLYSREEHGVTASVECGRYHCTITLHKRDGSDVVASVNPRASVVEVQTAIDAAIKQVPVTVMAQSQFASHYNNQLAASQASLGSYNAQANSIGLYGSGITNLGALLGLYPLK